MKQDRVEVIFRGGPIFLVDRVELARNMQRDQRVARYLGLRPGQQTGERFAPNNDLSSDLIATGRTIIDTHRR